VKTVKAQHKTTLHKMSRN